MNGKGEVHSGAGGEHATRRKRGVEVCCSQGKESCMQWGSRYGGEVQ